MRTNRFTSPSKPRSIDRTGLIDLASEDSAIFCEYADNRLNLQDEGVYSFGMLEPVETKHCNNLEAYPYVFEEEFDVLSWASAVITESSLGFALLREAEDSGWRVSLSDLGTEGFHLDVSNKIIELDNFHMDAKMIGKSSFFRNNVLLILIKALRDVWHEDRWGAFEENYKPEAVLLLERARAADTDSVSILVSWELRNAGYNDVWRHNLGGVDGDMARVLINLLERNPAALYDGVAMEYLFRQWYVDVERVDALDYISLQQMDDILQENDIKFGKKLALSKEYEMISLLPDGCTYLKELGQTIAKDPFFNGFNDPFNQSHLFQIIYDSKVTYANGIPFRDAKLARKFFG